ncbi:MAG: TlpA disulfide reductase family protein [Lutibacter sp.]|jgi:thiol-disulfide isomerase/thioredoxin|nr:TlpA disulfide reductase family protein [Lutibacter sp.]
MKNLTILCIVTVLLSCQPKKAPYVSVQGSFANRDLTQVTIQGQGFSKTIEVGADGTFSDTLAVTDGMHLLVGGNDSYSLFLRNGYDLTIEFSGMRMSDGASFRGEGSVTNNYIDQKRAFFMGEIGNPSTYFELEEKAFQTSIARTEAMLESYVNEAPGLDTLVARMDKRQNKLFLDYIRNNYQEKHQSMVKLAEGKPSPLFENYENFDGSRTSLTDLRGKYVYIDVWATWCAPCKAEIPHLQALEKAFHGKNIHFVSISVDRKNAYQSWREMITEKSMSGIQLYAENNFDADFIRAYGIDAIPRFILLDPQGNIVSADADRPSNPALKKQLEALGI